MATRKASIKETGEEISQADWERFDAAVARAKAERADAPQGELDLVEGRMRRVATRAPPTFAARRHAAWR